MTTLNIYLGNPASLLSSSSDMEFVAADEENSFLNQYHLERGGILIASLDVDLAKAKGLAINAEATRIKKDSEYYRTRIEQLNKEKKQLEAVT